MNDIDFFPSRGLFLQGVRYSSTFDLSSSRCNAKQGRIEMNRLNEVNRTDPKVPRST